MIIYTSYFAMTDKVETGGNKISIARYTPEFFKNNESHMWMEELAPTPHMMYVAKTLKDRDEYIRLYNAHLNTLDPLEVVTKIGHNGIIFCYETSHDFCHRQLVAEWLRSHGFNVVEYTRRY